MSSKTFDIVIEGYWREVNKLSIPSCSGVYFVYECSFNTFNNSVDLLKLLYIGESHDVHKRISKHEKQKDWLRYVQLGNELCFSVAKINPEDRARIEATLINKHKPVCNNEFKDDFPFDLTSVLISGVTKLLSKDFTVK